MTETRARADPSNHLVGRRRFQLAVLILSHLGLTCLAAAATWRLEWPRRDWQDLISHSRLFGLYGFQIGQITLLVCWGAFSGSPWFLRIPRFLVLTAWFLLLGFLGNYLVAVGDTASQLVEELTAYNLLLALPSLLVLSGFRAITGCRFLPAQTLPRKVVYQFATKHLLLITAEAAVLLALARSLIPFPWHPRLAEEFWTALINFRQEDYFFPAIAIIILPVVFFDFFRIRSWWPYAVLALYLLVPSFFLACVLTDQFYRSLGPAAWQEWWQLVGMQFLDCFWAHASAACTILFTFYLLRLIGYDFRRRGEGPEGRNSSNARNSAASASA